MPCTSLGTSHSDQFAEDGNQLQTSTNPTWQSGQDRFVTEIGILDAADNLVLVGKLSRPIRIADSSTASIELTIDF